RSLYNGIRRNQRSHAEVHNFRRNIHRLEKGLSYQTRKDVFAEDYIQATIEQLRVGKTEQLFDVDTISWGEAVLTKYFNTVIPTPIVEEAQRLFCSLSPVNRHRDWVPYPSFTRDAVSVRYEDLYNLAV